VRLRWHDLWYPLNSFRGVYGSFAEAAAAAPDIKPLGYDAANSASWYAQKMQGVLPEDRRVVERLRAALGDSRTVLEIGGHVGTAFYGFQSELTYPTDLKWTIWDVPSICEAGRALARERGATALTFVPDPALAPPAEIVLAAGALQYVDTPQLETLLSGRRGEVRHLLINLLPAYDGPEFVTLQNIGSAFCPYRVFNRRALVEAMAGLGFELVEEWKKARAFSVRFHPERAFAAYSGFYFRAVGE